jgi:hypothetical protein
MVLVLKQFGVAPEGALSLSILFGALVILAHLPTMLFYVYKQKIPLISRSDDQRS